MGLKELKTNQFKVKKRGMFWHLMRKYEISYTTGWWIFKKTHCDISWRTEFPYYYFGDKGKGLAIKSIMNFENVDSVEIE